MLNKDKNIGLVFNCDMNFLLEYFFLLIYMYKYIFWVFDVLVLKILFEV